jgi:magnesium transporter
MKRLTVFGAIFAALTVLTGVYGMNFEHMPELQWRYGYAMVWLMMIAVTAGLLILFKKKEWL